MAADSQGSFFSSISPQQLLAIFTLLGSMALLQFPPLQSRRDAETLDSASVPNDDHLFHASNIEDPLEALKAQKVVHPEDEEKFDAKTMVQAFSHWGFYHSQLQPHLTAAQKEPVMLLFAYLRSGDDAPSREQRQRDRQAVVYGLHNSGYVPETERSLQCLQFKAPTEKMRADGMVEPWNPGYNSKAGIDIPFEWFKPVPGGGAAGKPECKGVCVLWLDTEVFSKIQMTDETPLDCLRSVIFNLTTGHPRPKEQTHVRQVDLTKVKIGMLGPPSSDMLIRFISEANRLAAKKEAAKTGAHSAPGPKAPPDEGSPEAHPELRWQGPIKMISPYATTAAKALVRIAGVKMSEVDAACRDSCETKVLELMNKALAGDKPAGEGLFLRVPCSEDYVAEAIIQEMELRGMQFDRRRTHVDGTKDGGDIVLLSEFDTSYGRELPLTYYAAASGKGQVHALPGGENTHWHWSSYTRGLDGRFSVGKADTPKKDDGGSTKGTEQKRDDEEPRGINETDALRRLARQLKELHHSRQREGKPGIVAVGVLGGDVYDQLLTLRALRPSFPQALFFCNNLDAWLWNHDELRTTRNLVIATPFGLTLPEKWQKGKPPFRNAYQTAVFAGTLALTSAEPYLSPALPAPPAAAAEPMALLPPTAFAALSPAAVPVAVARAACVPAEPEVHRYEIGHYGPVELNRPREAPFWSTPEREFFLWVLAGMIILSWLFWAVNSNLPFIRRIWKKLSAFNDLEKPAIETREWFKSTCGRLAANGAWVGIIIVLVIVFLLEPWKLAAEDAAGEGEPLELGSGVSAWPMMGLHLAAALLAVHLMLKTLYLLWQGERKLKATYFHLQAGPPTTRSSTWEFALKAGITVCLGEPCLLRVFPDIPGLKFGTYLRERLSHHRGEMRKHFKHACSGLFLLWNAPKIIIDTNRDVRHAFDENKDLDPYELWKAYRLSSKIGARLARSAVVTLVICAVAMVMSQVLPDETYAIRGAHARAFASTVELLGLVAFVWLGALVFDTLWLNRVFIDWFGEGQSLWPQKIMDSFFSSHVNQDAQRDYIDLRLIEDWTREIGRLTALPFYVLACLCVARLGWFDQTTYPWHVIAVMVFMAGLVIFGALRVHRAAENLRTKALRSNALRSKVQRTRGLRRHGKAAEGAESAEVEKTALLIKDISGGAFMSFWRQPVMEAVYWLVSALSVTGLWQTVSHFMG